MAKTVKHLTCAILDAEQADFHPGGWAQPALISQATTLVDVCLRSLDLAPSHDYITTDLVASLPDHLVPRVWEHLTFSSNEEELKTFFRFALAGSPLFACQPKPNVFENMDQRIERRAQSVTFQLALLEHLLRPESTLPVISRPEWHAEDATLDLRRVRLDNDKLLRFADVRMTYALSVRSKTLEDLQLYTRRVRSRDFACGLVLVEIQAPDDRVMEYLAALRVCSQLKLVLLEPSDATDPLSSMREPVSNDVDRWLSKYSWASTAITQRRPVNRRSVLALTRTAGWAPVLEPYTLSVEEKTRFRYWGAQGRLHLVVDYPAARPDIESWVRAREAIEIAKMQEKNKERRPVDGPSSSGPSAAKKRHLAAAEKEAFGGAS